MRPRILSTLALLLLGPAICAPSQTVGANPRNVDATGFGQRVALGPEWLFAPGDNLAYASAGFDDSGWKTVTTTRELADFGFHDNRYGWYRLHIHLRPDATGLMVGMSGVNGSYEVYANGARVGVNGNMAGMSRFGQTAFTAWPVDDQLLRPKGDLVLAIRFAFDSAGARGRGTSTPLDSDSAVELIGAQVAPIQASYVAARKGTIYIVLTCQSLLAGLIAFSLFRALRSQLEYLAVAVYLLASSGAGILLVWSTLHGATLPLGVVQFIFVGIANFALIEFVRLVLNQTHSRWLVVLELASLVAPLESPLGSVGIGTYFGFAAYFLPILIVDILLPVMLVKGWRRGNLEARVLLPAVLLYGFAQYWNFLRWLVFYTHITVKLHAMPTLHLGSYNIDLRALGDFVFYTTMLLFLVLRTVGIARDRARAAGELEAASTTQKLLLARASQPTPGFRVESVYYPASEVGGDFFYVSSSPSGSLMAIVGDVSGKGLIAAMRVAMILGVLRREDSWEPAQVLGNLNQALQTRGELSFTTACCLRMEKDGRYTLANAGHISPYVDGKEIATPPALPLGLNADQRYIPVSGSLSPVQRLVLMSDGVVEARSTSGQLLGFDRLAALTRKPAHEIADTARRFGQEDDITVLTLARTA
jgi:hypothetical protein